MDIIEILENRKFFITGKRLAERVNVSERTLRTKIRNLRREGYLIVSSNKGYKLAKSTREFKDLERFARSILYTIGRMKRQFAKNNMYKLV